MWGTVNKKIVGGVQTVSLTKNISLKVNSGVNFYVSYSDLGIPDTAKIIGTNIHQSHSGSADDVFYYQAIGYQWINNILNLRVYSRRDGKVDYSVYIDVAYTL